jgi:hypothetical protein
MPHSAAAGRLLLSYQKKQNRQDGIGSKIELLLAASWPAELGFASNSFGPRRQHPALIHLFLLMSGFHYRLCPNRYWTRERAITKRGLFEACKASSASF